MYSGAMHLKGGPGLFYQCSVAVEHELYCFTPWLKAQIVVYVFNTVSLRWRKLRPLTHVHGRGENRGHFFTAVLIEDIIYIWGGHRVVYVLYVFHVDCHRWFEHRVSGTVPGARYDHSACVLGKFMFIHGGRTGWADGLHDLYNGLYNDMYKLDTATMVWSLINTRGTPPPRSSGHSATMIGTKMFVFGGRYNYNIIGYNNGYNNIRVFDTETNCWLNINASAQLPSEGRWGHSAFACNGELYIFGGHYMHQTFNDLWKFNPESISWTRVKPRGKGPPMMYGMCCWTVGERIFLFGGVARHNDLYILDLGLPNLKALCKLAVIRYGLEQSELPHNIRWELAAMV